MSLEKDRDNANLRKGLFEIMAKYIKLRNDKVYEYVELIRVRPSQRATCYNFVGYMYETVQKGH